MRTNVPDVFCAGDLACFPLAVAKNQLVNIGHWQMAQAQGSDNQTTFMRSQSPCCFVASTLSTAHMYSNTEKH